MIRIFVLAFLMFSSFCRGVDSYLLEKDDPLHKTLKTLFSSEDVLDSKKSLEKAGFRVLVIRTPSFVVAKHPKLPGYVIKVHLQSSSRSLEQRWNNFICRCKGAEAIQNIIDIEGLKYFTVPKKKIYESPMGEPILLATHINILSYRDSEYAWKYVAKKKHVEELYCLLHYGYGSSKLPENIPYTKEGKFALIDTERPARTTVCTNGKRHLSKSMRQYFNSLVLKGEKR